MRRELREVEQAAAKVARAEGDLTAARRELRQKLRSAHDSGASYSELGRLLGVSRQRVAELVRDQ